MMLKFAESGHPVFWATSALERGEFRSNGKGKKSIYFNVCDETVELILRTVISVNQLSVSAEQSQTCAKNQTQIQIILKVRRLHSLVNRLRLPMLTPHLRVQDHWHRVTCCKITKGYSQNFLIAEIVETMLERTILLYD